MTLKLPAANLTTMDFVGTVRNAQQTRRRIRSRQSIVVGDPGAAKSLDGIVDHIAGHARDGDLDHGNFRSGGLVANRIHHMGRLQGQQSRLLDEDPRFRNPLESHTAFGDGLAKGNPLPGPDTHFLQGPFGQANEAHAMMDAPWPEASLGDLEAAPFTQKNICDRDADILKDNFRRPIGHAVEIEHRQGSNDAHARCLSAPGSWTAADAGSGCRDPSCP